MWLRVTNPTGIQTLLGSLASLSGLRIWRCLSCGIDHRCDLDPVLLWLWYRVAAVDPIQPLAWEPPYATGVALKKQKKKKKKKIEVNFLRLQIKFLVLCRFDN